MAHHYADDISRFGAHNCFNRDAHGSKRRSERQYHCKRTDRIGRDWSSTAMA